MMNPIWISPVPLVVTPVTDTNSPPTTDQQDGTLKVGYRQHAPYSTPPSRLPLTPRKPPPKRRHARHAGPHIDEEGHEDPVMASQTAEDMSLQQLLAAWMEAPSADHSGEHQGQSDGGKSAAPWHTAAWLDDVSAHARRRGGITERSDDAHAPASKTATLAHQPAAAVIPDLQTVARGFLDIVQGRRGEGEHVLAQLHRWMAQHIAAGHHPDAPSHDLDAVLDALAAILSTETNALHIRPETAALLPLMLLVTMRRRTPRDASRAADRMNLPLPRADWFACR